VRHWYDVAKGHLLPACAQHRRDITTRKGALVPAGKAMAGVVGASGRRQTRGTSPSPP